MPHTHAKRPRRGRGRRAARRLWDSRLRAGQPQREGSRNPRCRLAHLRRAERNPRPRRGQRTKPHPTTAPSDAPPPTSAPRHNKPHPVHVRPAEGKKRSGKATPGARHQPKKGTPAGRKIQITGGRTPKGNADRSDRRPDHERGTSQTPARTTAGEATAAPATSRPARTGERRTTHPKPKDWAAGAADTGQAPDPAPPEHRRRDTPVRAARETPNNNRTGRPGPPAERSGAGDSIAKPPLFLTAPMDGSGFLYLILGHYFVT